MEFTNTTSFKERKEKGAFLSQNKSATEVWQWGIQVLSLFMWHYLHNIIQQGHEITHTILADLLIGRYQEKGSTFNANKNISVIPV